MPLNAAEEESLEALKAWWDDNGRVIIVVAVLAVGGWGGWTFWQSNRAASAAAASDLYEEILSVAMVTPGTTVSDEGRQQIFSAAATLKSEYPATAYASFGALFAAQQATQQGDLETAARELQWVVDNAPSGGLFGDADPALRLTAQLRLGRVLLAQGQPDAALAVVNGVNPESLEAAFAELRGDIYVAQGQVADARDAYLTAQQAGSDSPVLRMKMEDLAP